MFKSVGWISSVIFLLFLLFVETSTYCLITNDLEYDIEKARPLASRSRSKSLARLEVKAILALQENEKFLVRC